MVATRCDGRLPDGEILPRRLSFGSRECLLRFPNLQVVRKIARPVSAVTVSFSLDSKHLIFGGQNLDVLDWSRGSVTESSRCMTSRRCIFAVHPQRSPV